MSDKCPTCHAPAKHMPPDGDFRYDPPRPPRHPSRNDVLEEAAREAWQELVDKDDRTSPEEYPEMALITFQELWDFMDRALKDRDG